MSHSHTLSLHQTPPYPGNQFMCNVCWEKGCGPVYNCSDCDFNVHAACAALAEQQTHFSHDQHPLHLTDCRIRGRKCNSCDKEIMTWAFRCDICDFDMHSTCVRAPRFIMHPSHDTHPLRLCKVSNILDLLRSCDGCGKMFGITNQLFYGCRECAYDLHQICARAPNKIKHPRHPMHILTLVKQPPREWGNSNCNECGEQVKGWCFHCARCNFNLHPVCSANLVHELPHSTHEEASVCEMRSNLARTSFHEKRNASTSSVLRNVPSDNDLAAVEKVLRYAREMVKRPM